MKTKVGFVEPMQCLAVAKLPEGPDWEYARAVAGIEVADLGNSAIVDSDVAAIAGCASPVDYHSVPYDRVEPGHSLVLCGSAPNRDRQSVDFIRVAFSLYVLPFGDLKSHQSNAYAAIPAPFAWTLSVSAFADGLCCSEHSLVRNRCTRLDLGVVTPNFSASRTRWRMTQSGANFVSYRNSLLCREKTGNFANLDSGPDPEWGKN